MIVAVLKIALRALARNKGRSASDDARHHHRRGFGDCDGQLGAGRADNRCRSRSRAWEPTCLSSRPVARGRAACAAARAQHHAHT